MGRVFVVSKSTPIKLTFQSLTGNYTRSSYPAESDIHNVWFDLVLTTDLIPLSQKVLNEKEAYAEVVEHVVLVCEILERYCAFAHVLNTY